CCTRRRTGARHIASSSSTCRRRRGCARPANARACSHSSRRWTSSRASSKSTRSSCASATSRSSTRNLVACLREGAQRFGWSPGGRRDGRFLYGMGVASSTYPARRAPSTAHARREDDGTFTMRIAADTLEVPLESVRVEIGDSDFGPAMLAGGSMGTSSWGTAVVRACRELAAGKDEATVDTSDSADADEPLSKHAFGAQFVEVRVDSETGEIRLPRVLGVFACGRIINPKTARSQLIG